MITHTEEDITAAASLLGVLGHAKRLEVMLLLHSVGPLSVSELIDRVGMEQSAMSHQLRVLRDARLVSSTRHGKRVLYRLHDHHIAHIIVDALAHVAEP